MLAGSGRPRGCRAARVRGSASSRLRRVLLIVLSFAFTLAGLLAAAVSFWWEPAYAAGQRIYEHRVLPQWIAKFPPRFMQRTVVWLGDSTMMTGNAYPIQLRAMTPGVSQEVLAVPGLDPMGFYLLLPEVLAHKPTVVVLLAHLHFLGLVGGRNVTDLASLLPWNEVPRATMLPFYMHGTTVPRMLLSRLLEEPAVLDAAYFAAGIRQVAGAAEIWGWFGSNAHSPGIRLAEFAKNVGRMFALYDTPLSTRTPGIRFLRESVRMATRRGVRVVVLVNPIPWEQMASIAHYDETRFAARIDLLRQLVTEAGGELIDLHHAMTRADFTDGSGHLNVEGHRRMAELLRPSILAAPQPRHAVQ